MLSISNKNTACLCLQGTTEQSPHSFAQTAVSSSCPITYLFLTVAVLHTTITLMDLPNREGRIPLKILLSQTNFSLLHIIASRLLRYAKLPFFCLRVYPKMAGPVGPITLKWLVQQPAWHISQKRNKTGVYDKYDATFTSELIPSSSV